MAYIGSNAANGTDDTSSVTVSVARAAGEGLVAQVWIEQQWSAVGTVSSVVWDSAGDNQSFTSAGSRQEGTENRRLSVFVLPAPTSAKTANVVATLSGTHSFLQMRVHRVTEHDTADMVRSLTSASESDPAADDQLNFPSTTSVAGDLVLFLGSVRTEAANLSAGDTSNYVEMAHTVSSRTIFAGTKVASGTSTAGYVGYADATSYSNALISLAIKAGSGGGGSTQPPRSMNQFNRRRA